MAVYTTPESFTMPERARPHPRQQQHRQQHQQQNDPPSLPSLPSFPGDDELHLYTRLWALYHADLVRRHLSRRTIQAYRDLWFAWCDWLDPRSPLQVNHTHATRFINRPSQGRGRQASPVLSESTRHSYGSQLRTLYRWLASEGITKRDLLAKFIPPATPDRRPRALPMATITTLLDHFVEQSGGDPRLEVMFWLAFGCGLRVGEIATLRTEHVHVHKACDPDPWLWVHGKGNKWRRVDMPPLPAEAIRAWVAGPPRRPHTGPFLPDLRRPTRGIGARWISHLIATTMHAAGVEETAHSLRHTFATELLKASDGTAIRAVSRLLGHASITVTEKVYVHSWGGDAVHLVHLLPDPRRTDQGT